MPCSLFSSLLSAVGPYPVGDDSLMNLSSIQEMCDLDGGVVLLKQRHADEASEKTVSRTTQSLLA